ncbi:lipoprotein-anchoring transpeptidase ErfK/SrfK [Hoeflea marina]|uniref:Lipoprotein-anchoring transpeptidase ErfK/SrfK n=1 Tax=Hoeflea marina TaxID=274592 RepID=A0A317PPC5_9HYPH|nr:L,D-transpeptidase [Hoeflea marina]PWW02131.1 lipoprotein-anchoring transpeptidase ErfK/SrfK [Hoeflea marina]
MITRRLFLGAASMAALSGCTTTGSSRQAGTDVAVEAQSSIMPAFYGAVEDGGFLIPAVPAGVVPPRYWRRRVANPFPQEAAGTIIVDPTAFHLHLVEEGGTAMRYGVGVGKQGFAWSGDAVIQYKRKWPTWKAPDDMVARNPKLEPYSVANGGMEPGLMNPLGARALYLFHNGEDTLYRLHGNPEANSIGKAVSSGCIRLLNQDIIDLHDRARSGGKVIVRPSRMPAALS